MDLSKLVYISCTKGGIHSGQTLNMVCLNQYCIANPLCCCACVEEFHQGHKTKTLKKMIMDADQITKKEQKQNKESAKQTESQFNFDIMHDLMSQNQSQTKMKFQQLKMSINKTLDQIQQNLNQYYKELKESLHTKNKKVNSSQNIKSLVQTLLSSKQFIVMTNSIQKLLIQMAKVDQNGMIHQVSNKPQSVINLVRVSNQQVKDIISGRLTQIRNVLTSSSNFLFNSILNIGNVWNKQIYQFSDVHHRSSIEIIDENNIKSTEGGQYQMALLQPSVQFGQSMKAFRFKIKKLSSNWIAVGVCHLKTALQKNYTFQYSKLGHGAYMISSNAGTWSSTTAEFNNKVKAFNFGQGDTITCIVSNQHRSIYFVKDIPVSSGFSKTQRQIYELPYTPLVGNPLHPCAVLYYFGTQIQYLPVTNMSFVPKYQYLFSQITKHHEIQVTNGRMAKTNGQNSSYRAALLNKSLQEGQHIDHKTFSFRIVDSCADWIAVGMCHQKTAINNGFVFNYDQLGHGYYMVSSNGGSWSHIDNDLNNVVRSFNFTTGDTIQCTVEFGQNKESLNNQIVFKKGSQRYSLNFKGIQGDKLYPCVVFFYSGDQVNILPQF